MTMTRKFYLIVAVATAFALAASSARAAETTNKLASNKLASNKLASNALSSTRLVAHKASAELLATADGRDVYSYLISCALPAGTTIQATIAGAPDSNPPDTSYTCSNGVCVFEGSIGLAEYWIDHRLAPTDQRWVSACIFARVNAHDTAEPISLRGPHDSLAVSAGEAATFPLQEGAFYGNLFTGDDAIDWNACRGKDQAAGEFGGLVDRDCAEPDPLDPTHTQCGFNYAGDCADYTPVFPSPYACKSFDTELGTFGDCHNKAGAGRWPASKTYREVITTYVPN